MPSKGKHHHTSWVRRGSVAIIVLCTSVWWASAGALAQDALAPGLGITENLNSSSLEKPGSEDTPYLVIGMADRSDNALVGSLPMARDEATNSSATDTIARQVDPAPSMNRAANIDSNPIVLLRLSNLQMEPINPNQTIQRSRRLASPEVYSVLDDAPGSGSFLYGYRASYLLQTEWFVDDGAHTHEIELAPSPLLQFKLGRWTFPVMLSSAAVLR